MFSEMVDRIATATGMTSKKLEIIKYINATIRECTAMAYFYNDLVEDQIVPTSDPHIWYFPENFRALRTVSYPDVPETIRNLPPGRIQEGNDKYYYNAQGYVVFVGTTQTETINVAYYAHPLRLNYYADGARPAVYNINDEAGDPILEGKTVNTWYYLENGNYVATLGDDDDDEAARLLVSNWVLFNWNHMVEEGSLSKLKSTTDDPRAAKHYGVYKEAQKSLKQSHPFDSMNV